jgi:hypothetical protein
MTTSPKDGERNETVKEMIMNKQIIMRFFSPKKRWEKLIYNLSHTQVIISSMIILSGI